MAGVWRSGPLSMDRMYCRGENGKGYSRQVRKKPCLTTPKYGGTIESCFIYSLHKSRPVEHLAISSLSLSDEVIGLSIGCKSGDGLME